MTDKRFAGEFDNQYSGVYDDGEQLSNFEVVRLLNELHEENEQLKTDNGAFIQDIEVFKEENTHLKLENEQLQQRNDRQAKRLGELYELMEKKDWESLTEIINDFKRCEEQLQREWRTLE